MGILIALIRQVLEDQFLFDWIENTHSIIILKAFVLMSGTK